MVVKQFTDLKARFSSVHELIKYRVTEILLISTIYDGFILEEDGQLTEQIYHQFSDLSIPYIPRIHQVSSQEEALSVLATNSIHLVITMSRISDMESFEFEQSIKEMYPDLPIVMLSYDRLTPDMIANIRRQSCINRIFYWSGDSRILLAIIKYIEDQINVAADSRQGVQAILLVEDSPIYYSRILPLLYTEILTQTRYLLLHAMNIRHGLLRIRLRPKILLAESYEEAMSLIYTYRDNLLGVISDVRYPRAGEMDPTAGFELVRQIRAMNANFPLLLQSEEAVHEERARALQAPFLNKNSPQLMHDLRTFILENYGFGSFVFKYPDGRVIAEAGDITSLERILRDLPDESLNYHAVNNHFSRWFRARTEFDVLEDSPAGGIEQLVTAMEAVSRVHVSDTFVEHVVSVVNQPFARASSAACR